MLVDTFTHFKMYTIMLAEYILIIYKMLATYQNISRIYNNQVLECYKHVLNVKLLISIIVIN